MKSFSFPGRARLLAVLSAAAIATVGSVLAASPAHAADTAQNRVVVLPNAESVRCFDTFDEVKQYLQDIGASFGPSKDATAAVPGSGSLAARSVAPATGGLKVIGIEYDYPLWDPLGGTFTLLGPRACTNTVGDVDYDVPDYAVYGFNQRISSFQTFNNCWAKHFDLFNYGGLAVGYQGSQAIINSALNNDTSSERWS
jgi:hypothetical protein